MTMNFPKIKDGHRPVRLSNGKIRIGGSTFGTAAFLDDPNGRLWEVLSFFDGMHSCDEIIRLIMLKYPDQDVSELRKCVYTIASSPYVENDKEDTWVDSVRYSRSTILYQWMDMTQREHKWTIQEKISSTSVAVLGVGGVGSYLAMNLAQKGYKKLLLADYDTVEISNLNRQLFNETDVGDSKISALKRRIKSFNSSVEVETLQANLENPTMLDDIFSMFDCVAISADSTINIRFEANKAALKYKTPWVQGGYQGPEIITGMYDPQEPGCYACMHQSRLSNPEFSVLEMWNENTIAPRKNAANATTTMLSAALLSNEIDSLVTGVPDWERNTEYWLNLISFDARKITLDINEVCNLCGGGA